MHSTPVGWVRIKDAAVYASVSTRTVSRWLQEGLRHSRLSSNSVRIKIEDLDSWMDRFCQHHVDIDEQVKAAMAKARKKLKSMGVRA
jgi:excisionase family DNA binding protein